MVDYSTKTATLSQQVTTTHGPNIKEPLLAVILAPDTFLSFIKYKYASTTSSTFPTKLVRVPFL